MTVGTGVPYEPADRHARDPPWRDFPHIDNGKRMNALSKSILLASLALTLAACGKLNREVANCRVSGELLQPAAGDSTPGYNDDTPPKRQIVTLSTDALFAFDKWSLADITGTGRADLDALADRILADDGIRNIRIVGYTDRLGGEAYNSVLSERRAYAVLHALERKGVPIERMTAEGFGASDPVITCGVTDRAALITCLAPNRRVEVTIRGKQQAWPAS